MEKRYFYNSYQVKKLGYKTSEQESQSLLTNIKIKVILYASCVILLIMSCMMLLVKTIGTKNIFNYLKSSTSKFILWVLNIKITIRGTLTTNRPLFIISNHYSWLDTIILNSIVSSTTVHKKDLHDNKIIAVLSKIGDHLPVDQTRRSTVKLQCKHIYNSLQNNNVILYPEGSTGKGGLTNKFLPALLSSASVDINNKIIKIQPMALKYTSIRNITCNRFMRNQLSWCSSQSLMRHIHMLIQNQPVNVTLIQLSSCVLKNYQNRHILAKSLQYQIQIALNQA